MNQPLMFLDKKNQVGGGTTTAQIFEETMNETLHCDVLQQELTQSMAKLLNTSSGVLTYVKIRPRKNSKTEAEYLRMANEKFES